MATTITLKINGQINTSLQYSTNLDDIGAVNDAQEDALDIVYFQRINNTGSTLTMSGVSVLDGEAWGDVIRLGECVNATQYSNHFEIEINIDESTNVQTPIAGDYIFFSKETESGISGLKGYFADVQMKFDYDNASEVTPIELFSVGSEVGLSSK